MQIFKIRQDGFKEIKKQMLIRAIPMMLISLTAGFVIFSINTKGKADDVNILPFAIPLVVLTVGYGLYRGTNRQKALFDSYTLTITNNLITREQLNTPTISIYFNDVKEIAKNKNGSFTIKGKDTADLIGIPAQIDNYPHLEDTLQQIQTIAVKEHVSFWQKYQGVVGLLTLGLMVCIYTVNNKIVVALTGTPLVALMVWSFVKIRSSKNVDDKTKKSAWWVLLVLASIIGVMIIKLTGFVDMQQR